jgi:hypothetical protein
VDYIASSWYGNQVKTHVEKQAISSIFDSVFTIGCFDFNTSYYFRGKCEIPTSFTESHADGFFSSIRNLSSESLGEILRNSLPKSSSKMLLNIKNGLEELSELPNIEYLSPLKSRNLLSDLIYDESCRVSYMLQERIFNSSLVELLKKILQLLPETI